jgi:signal transduction histidine kinase
MYNELHTTIAPKQILKASLHSAILCLVSYAFLTGCVIISGLQQVQAQELPTYRSRNYTTRKVDTTEIKKIFAKAAETASRNKDSAIAIFKQAMDLSSQINYTYGVARSMLAISYCEGMKGAYVIAIKTAKEAYQYCLQTNKPKLMAQYYLQMGDNYIHLGFNDTAVQYSHKVLEILNKHPNIDSGDGQRWTVYNRLGKVYASFRQYDFKLSFYYLEKARQIALAQKNDQQLLQTYIGLGSAFANKANAENNNPADYKKGLDYFTQAIALGEKSGYVDQLGNAYCNMGIIYINQDKLDSGELYINKALRDSMYIKDDVQSSIRPYMALGAAFFKKKNYTKAEAYLLKANEASATINAKNDRVEIYQALANLYINNKQYEKALVYQQAYSILRDSILNEEKINATAKLEIKYRTAEKDKEIAVQHLKLSEQQSLLREKNTWIGMGAISILLLIGFLFMLYKNSRHRQQRQEEQLQLMEQEQQLWKQGEEIRNLNAMVKGEERERARLGRELHDGIVGQLAAAKMNFTAIQNKYHEPELKADFRIALHHLDETALELRKTAHNLMPEILIQQGLVIALESFCEKTSAFTGIQISFHHEEYVPRLDIDFELSVYRMVQELVQNIIKHANATKALVQIDYHEPLLIVTVEDDGIGIDKNEPSFTNGMGLNNISTRIKALQGNFEITGRKGEGTSVYIEFDVSIIKSVA